MIKKICIPVFALFFLISFFAWTRAEPLKAPNFSLPDLNGKQVSLSDFKSKGNLVLFFWATWCPHCRVALEQLRAKSGKFTLITINVGEQKNKIEKFMQKNAYNYTVLLDEENDVAFSYGVLGIPTFIAIDKDLNITYKGYTFPTELEHERKY
ncbi:MAG: TlpA disulfide reductase family protein [Candidatus Omnitrophota bacterium]